VAGGRGQISDVEEKKKDRKTIMSNGGGNGGVVCGKLAA